MNWFKRKKTAEDLEQERKACHERILLNYLIDNDIKHVARVRMQSEHFDSLFNLVKDEVEESNPDIGCHIKFFKMPHTCMIFYAHINNTEEDERENK